MLDVEAVATLATPECVDELRLFVSSLRQHHPTIPIVVGCSSAVIKMVGDEQLLAADRRILWVPCLDQYGAIDRATMERTPGTWFPTRHADFMMEKANVMQHVLEKGIAANVLFLDCDIVTLAPLQPIPKGCSLAVSPHGIARSDEALWGKYNGGLVWTSNPQLLFEWRRHTHLSRFHDQASLEDVVAYCHHSDDKAIVHEFGPEVNYGYWRMFQTEKKSGISLRDDGAAMEAAKFVVEPGQPIRYNSSTGGGGKLMLPLQSVHTHFFLKQPPMPMALFNGLVKKWVRRCGKDVYRGLAGALI